MKRKGLPEKARQSGDKVPVRVIMSSQRYCSLNATFVSVYSHSAAGHASHVFFVFTNVALINYNDMNI